MHGASLSPMMSDALVILGAAGIVIPVFARFRITPVIGFILIGLLVGPYGLGRMVPANEWLYYVTITDREGLEPFAEFGITLLLFTIGLELSFNRLWTMRKLVFGLGALELAISAGLLAVLLALMGQYWSGALALGLALALSSTALVLPITGTQTPVGRAALSMLLFEDIMIVPIIFVLGALAPYAGSDGMEAIMEPFKGLALGVFLITVGMGIDLLTIWDNLGPILLAVVSVLTLKALVTGVLLRLMGARRGIAVETGILMASPSETTLIVLATATTALLIQPATAQFWQIVTAIGLTVTPLLAKLGNVLARQVEPAEEPGLAPTESSEPPAIIVGCGRVGRLVAQMLTRHGKPYIAIDADSDQIAQCKSQGYNAIFANAARLDVLEKLGVESAPAVILTMDEPVLAQRLVRKLRAAYPLLPIIARARDSTHAAELYRAGASP